MPTITVDENATEERYTGGGDKTIPTDQVKSEFAAHGYEMVAADPADFAADGDGEEDPDAVLGTDADPDFVEHGNHTEEGEVVDECPYCPVADEQHDDGSGADDDEEGDG